MVFDNANVYLPGTIQIPSSLEITAISRASPMVLTVLAEDYQVNTYQAGQKIKLTIPFLYGMQQANGQIYKITGVSGSTITVDADSRLFDSFSVPASGQKPASLAPNGSQNLQFSNITANEPFQSYNDLGN